MITLYHLWSWLHFTRVSKTRFAYGYILHSPALPSGLLVNTNTGYTTLVRNK